MKTIVAIDNGVTGSIAVLYPNGKSAFLETPVVKVREYTQKVQHFHRIDWRNLLENLPTKDSIAVLERPMVNDRAFVATKSALRALEATLIVLEMLDIPYEFIDSKTWQREFISSGIIGHDKMKEASLKIGIELFPQHRTKIEKHGDADALLIGEYYRRKLDK